MIKEFAIPVMLSLITTLLNYIFINSISSTQQKLIIQDLKQVMAYLKDDLKTSQKAIQDDLMKSQVAIISQIKEVSEKKEQFR